MAWARLDDQANGNGKLLALSNAAWRLWGCGLIYCQANLTDGFIPDHAIETFGVRFRDRRERRNAVEELQKSLVPGKGPLWHRVDGGFQVHDYLDWNDSREEILKARAQGKARLDRFRNRLAEDRAAKERAANGVGNAFQLPFETPHDTRAERSSTTTTTTDQEESAAPAARHRPVELVENPKVLGKIAHTVADEIDAGTRPAVDRWEAIKDLAAKAGIRYDGTRIDSAVMSADVQRARKSRAR